MGICASSTMALIGSQFLNVLPRPSYCNANDILPVKSWRDRGSLNGSGLCRERPDPKVVHQNGFHPKERRSLQRWHFFLSFVKHCATKLFFGSPCEKHNLECAFLSNTSTKPPKRACLSVREAKRSLFRIFFSYDTDGARRYFRPGRPLCGHHCGFPSAFPPSCSMSLSEGPPRAKVHRKTLEGPQLAWALFIFPFSSTTK